MASTGTAVATHAATSWDQRREALERAWRFGRGDAAMAKVHQQNVINADPWGIGLVGALGAALVSRRAAPAVPAVIALAAAARRLHARPAPQYLLLIAVHRAAEAWFRVRGGQVGKRFIFHELQPVGHIDRTARRGWEDMALLLAAAALTGARK